MPELAITEKGETKDQPKPRNDAEFLSLARKRFNRAATAEGPNRTAAIEDLKFKNGDQWPESIRNERTLEKRPCLTVNKMKTFVHQITNDQRQNRPSINISPVGDKSDPKTAKFIKGLVRNIERQSHADIAYDTGFESAVSNGWGYWRVLTEYEDEDTFNQCIKIARIRNPFRVYIDPDHQEPDGSDMNWCFISDMITREEFRLKYPGKDAMVWDPVGLGDEWKNFSSESHIRISEYFDFKITTRRLLALNNGHVGYADEMHEDALKNIKNERQVETRKVVWYTITGKQILEEQPWVGKWIPVIKCIGDESDVEGQVTYAGAIRDAKDPQRMKNYWVTAKTELVALAPKAPWVMEEGQIEGHENRWKQANTKSYPYLLYKGTSTGGKPAPPPQRQPFAGPPAGVIEAEMSSEQDMMATTGIRFDATKSERNYDESGKALQQLKQNSALGNFHYVDNLARSLRHTGNILVDLIPKIYDTARVVTILREDDKEEQVRIDPNHPQASGTDDKAAIKQIYNPNVGKYAVVVNIGPNYATKRAESAESMINFLKVLPTAAPLVGDLIAKNMDWPGSEEIAERMKRALPPQVLESEVGDLPPEAQAVVGSMQQQMAQLKQERDHAVAMITDKNADRELERDKINKDFEAKLTKVAADMQMNLLGSIQGPMEDITNTVSSMEQQYKQDQEVNKVKEQYEQQAQQQRGNDVNQLSEAIKATSEQTKEHTTKLREELKGHVDKLREEHKSHIEKLAEKIDKPRKSKITAPSGRVYVQETS